MSRTSTGKLTIQDLEFRKFSWDAALPSPTQKRNITLLAESIEIAEITPISETRFAENPATEIKITIIDDFKTYSSETDDIYAWGRQNSIQLEPGSSPSGAQTNQSQENVSTFQALIVAGASSEDSPVARVDSNNDKSVFDGVVSIRVNTRGAFYYIGSGTPISSNQILTAAHVIDINGDGKSDGKDRITGITINFNYGSSYSAQISAFSWVTHPDFTGFDRPSINDDLAIITLNQSIPNGVPIYPLYKGSLTGQTITMVGYGQSGSGSTGYTVDASLTVKRKGANVVDAFYGQDDSGRTAANEVFRFDFDSPSVGNGPLGQKTLGNTSETTLGGGDSGGPSFVYINGQYALAGVNTYSESLAGGPSAPYYGSMGGGMSVPAYESWITAVAPNATFIS